MLNHNRTLLLNLPHTEDPVFISEGYFPIPLPPNLQKIDRLFFGIDTSIFYRKVVTQQLLATMLAGGYRWFEKHFDNRVTYIVTEQSNYFLVRRTTIVAPSHVAYPAIVTGRLHVTDKSFLNYIDVEVRQRGDQISFFDTASNAYLLDASGERKTTVTEWNTGEKLSAPVDVGQTGLQVKFSGADLDDWQNTVPNKRWTFRADGVMPTLGIHDLDAVLSRSAEANQMVDSFADRVVFGAVSNQAKNSPFALYRVAAKIVLYIAAVEQWKV